MNPEFFYLADLILLVRLFLFFRDRPLGRKPFLLKTGIELLGLLVFQRSLYLLLLAAGIILLNLFHYLLGKDGSRLNLKRLFILFLTLLLMSILFSPRLGIFFNREIAGAAAGISSFSLALEFLRNTITPQLLVILFGLLLSLNETNIFIRYFFQLMGLVPLKSGENSGEEIDENEYNRGRIIGFLERILIFFFVLESHFSAIGFILAAKGITRFRELEQRRFAEYFLIGTLLSSILAGGIALLVRAI